MPDLSGIMPYLTAGSWLFTAIGVSALLAAIMPPATVASSSWWTNIRRVIDVLGMNVGNAK